MGTTIGYCRVRWSKSLHKPHLFLSTDQILRTNTIRDAGHVQAEETGAAMARVLEKCSYLYMD